MNNILMVFGLLFFGIGLLVPRVFKYEFFQERGKGLFSALAVAGIVILLFGASFKIIPTNYTGIRTTFGQVSETVVKEGFNWKIPFIQDIEVVNNKQTDVNINSKVWGETSEKTPVYAADIVVSYHVNPEKSAYLYKNVSNTKNLIDEKITSSAIKSSLVTLSVKEATVRNKIEPLVKENLQISLNEKYGENTIIVSKVIINDMDFEDDYNAAIAEKSITQQVQEKQEIENNTAIAKAEADKKVKIVNAEAEAEATRIKAEAEAEANKVLAKSLTDPILRSKFYDKWNGTLPSVMGENTAIVDIGQ